MARPVTYDTEEILASARKTFLEIGPSASTQVLAKNAGVSEGTLFKRFGNKKNLFLQAIQFPSIEEQAWFRNLLDRAKTHSLEQVLFEAGLGLQQHFSQALPSIQMMMAYPDLTPADHRAVMGCDNPMPLAIKRRFRELFQAEMDAGRIARGDAYALACFYAGAVINEAHHRLILEVRDEEGGPDDFARRMARTMVTLLGLDPAQAA